MRRKIQTIISALVLLALVTGQAAWAQEAGQKDKKDKPAQAPVHAQPQGAFPPPSGNGTPGQITKWTSPSTLGDSVISEDKFGKIGVGTTMPGSKLTVAGMIETTAQGVKYPDGTVQTTAAVSGLSAVIHDNTLKGNGTQASPLGLAQDNDKQAYQARLSLTMGPQETGVIGTIPIPQGKRLVIEYISVFGSIGPSEASAFVQISTKVSNSTVNHLFYLTKQNDIQWGADHVVRLYADSGFGGLDVIFNRSGHLDDIEASFTLTLTGYLVDLP